MSVNLLDYQQQQHHHKQIFGQRKFSTVDKHEWNNIGSIEQHYNGKSMEKLKFGFFGGQTTGALLVLFTLSIVLIKFCVQLTGKSFLRLGTNNFWDLMTNVQIFLQWTTTNYGYILWPFVCGILVTIFTWTMVYFDSDIPGINPPSPLSPQKKNNFRYRNPRNSTVNCHFSYLTAIASGGVVFFLLYFSNLKNI